MRSLTRPLIMALGILSTGAGVLGMFLPLVPTTPFLLLAAVCFARSSQRAHTWLLTNPLCGAYIRDYQENRGMSLKHKMLSLSLLWLTIGYSALFAVQRMWLRLLLLAVAAGVTVHIVGMRTSRECHPEGAPATIPAADPPGD